MYVGSALSKIVLLDEVGRLSGDQDEIYLDEICPLDYEFRQSLS